MRQEEEIMKKNYEKPTVEIVKFQYRDQVVATSGPNPFYCGTWYYHERDDGCNYETQSKY